MMEIVAAKKKRSSDRQKRSKTKETNEEKREKDTHSLSLSSGVQCTRYIYVYKNQGELSKF